MKIQLNRGVFVHDLEKEGKLIEHKAEEIVDALEADARYLLGMGAARKPDAKAEKAAAAADPAPKAKAGK